MKVDWTLMAIAIGIFAITCLFPFAGRRAKSKIAKSYWAAFDAGLSVLSFILAVLAFSNRLWGFVIVFAITTSAAKVAKSVLGKDLESWYRDGETTQDPEPTTTEGAS